MGKTIREDIYGLRMRREFARFITEVAENDSTVVLIVGDIGFRIFDEFRKKFPDRFINIGICEQTMIGMAAGMSLIGLKPYIYTITPFLIERPYEFIKVDIDLNKANVVLVGYADYPELGPTHAALDEEKLMSTFNNITSYFPKNSTEARRDLDKSYESDSPSFISLKRDRTK